jgi:hypothetical protein
MRRYHCHEELPLKSLKDEFLLPEFLGQLDAPHTQYSVYKFWLRIEKLKFCSVNFIVKQIFCRIFFLGSGIKLHTFFLNFTFLGYLPYKLRLREV